MGRAFAESGALVGQDGGVLAVLILRGVLSPFAHPLFTSMIGIGCGLAAVSRSAPARVLYVLVGYALAVVLHALWNSSATFGGGETFLGVYLFVMVRTRAQVVRTARSVLHDRGFVEVETPMLQLQHGGATARPFVTHANALDTDLYLRIAPELFLKRTVVGGIERVFEINRNFRNEGIDSTHSPEFAMLEAYQAYATYDDVAALTHDLVIECVRAVFGTDTVRHVYRLDWASPGFVPELGDPRPPSRCSSRRDRSVARPQAGRARRSSGARVGRKVPRTRC